MNILDVFSLLGITDALKLFSFLGTIAIFIAALVISSKKAMNPKIRIYAFIAYIGACIFMGTWGALMNDVEGDWLVIQQTFLFFINCRGIYNARKELKYGKKDPFDASVPKDFWEDIMNDEGMDHEY